MYPTIWYIYIYIPYYQTNTWSTACFSCSKNPHEVLFFRIEPIQPSESQGQLEPTTGPRDWFFQWAFCSAAATIVSGGVAERVAYAPYVVFSFLMTAGRRRGWDGDLKRKKWRDMERACWKIYVIFFNKQNEWCLNLFRICWGWFGLDSDWRSKARNAV